MALWRWERENKATGLQQQAKKRRREEAHERLAKWQRVQAGLPAEAANKSLQWHPTDGYPLAHPAARLLVGRGCHDSVQSCTV